MVMGGCGVDGMTGGVFASVFKMLDFIEDVVTVRQDGRKIYLQY